MESAPSAGARSRPAGSSSFPPLAPASATPPPADAGAEPARRLQYVDALRVGAIALVFVAHVAEVFNPWDEWHVTNAVRSRAIGELTVLAAPWVMPLVMLLAGVDAWYSLRRRDNATYLRERLARLLLPLVVGTLVLVPPQVWLERRLRGQFDGSLLEFYPHFVDGIYPNGNLSWHHLWFLAHLLLYSVIALPLFRHWQRVGGRRTMHWAARLAAAPGGLLWLALPLVLERSLLWGLFPERHMLTSDWSNHALLFVAYLYGFVLAGSPWLGAAIDAQWRRALAAAVTGSAALVLATWNDIVPERLPPPYVLRYLLFWILYAVCAWSWMVGMLGVGRRWLDRDRALLRYARRIGYAVYLVHQPVIVAVAYVVVQWTAPVGVKFGALFALSAIGTLAGAELLVRLLAVGARVGGGRPREGAPPHQWARA